MARGRETVGRRGELAAWSWYRRRGFRLLARNWRSRLGELDLVVGQPGLVVFCEVKTRSSSRLGSPYESVHAAKQRKVRLLAESFIASEHPAAARFRFDVASVSDGGHGRPQVHVFEDAF